MNKPSNYDDIALHRDPIKLGGHIAVIKKVEETKSKAGKDQVVIYIDFDIQDEQADYFKKIYQADTRQEKKWPNDGTLYITNNDQAIFDRNIKAFNTAYEDSNGVQTIWGSSWAAQFKGKKIGVVYGEEESVWRDELRTNRKIRFFCDTHKALDQDIPKKKLYKGIVGTQTTEDHGADPNAFMDFTDLPEDDGLPFN